MIESLCKTLGLEPLEGFQLFPLTPIFVGYRGSQTHGTYMAPAENHGFDDTDLVVVYIPPGLECYFGLRESERGIDKKVRQFDCAAYELRHFVRLIEACNPNLVSALWLDERHWLHATESWRALVKARDLFSSKRAEKSFRGYAMSQLLRMTAYHDRGEDTCCPGEKFHTLECPLRIEHGRGSHKKFATGFMGAKRKTLVEKFGYDVKNAAHLIRLLAMGTEFLTTGQLHVDRTGIDADKLMAIKRGEWKIDQVNIESERLFDEMDAACDTSPLPDQPKHEQIEKLLMQILSSEKMAQVVLAGTEFQKGSFLTAAQLAQLDQWGRGEIVAAA